MLSDAGWKVNLLLRQGIVFRRYRPFTWRGAEKFSEEELETARRLKEQLPGVRESLDALKKESLRGDNFDAFLERYKEVRRRVNGLANGLDALHQVILLRRTLKALRLAQETLPEAGVSLPSEKVVRKTLNPVRRLNIAQATHQIEELRKTLKSSEKSFREKGWRVGTLSLAYRNPFCWTDDTKLIGSDLAEWGILVRELPPQWYVSMDGKWRFRIDPNNVGLKEKWYSVGYNVELQWRELRVPGSWESQGIVMLNPNAPVDNTFIRSKRTDMMYNGYAWYRSYVRIPGSWKGQELFLEIRRVDDWDWVYFNGVQIEHSDNTLRRWWVVPRR